MAKRATTETPATRDLACWLWAAWPNDGVRLDLARIGDDLGRAPRTIRGWITADRPLVRLQPAIARQIRQRAILRGRGTYLWPAPDPGTLARQEARRAHAQHAYEITQQHPHRIPADWAKNGALRPHRVVIAHHPRAHAYGVAAISAEKVMRRLELRADIVATATTPDRYTAHLLKHAVLEQHAAHRCITPTDLVELGHTETWREGGTPQPIPDLANTLTPIALVEPN